MNPTNPTHAGKITNGTGGASDLISQNQSSSKETMHMLLHQIQIHLK